MQKSGRYVNCFDFKNLAQKHDFLLKACNHKPVSKTVIESKVTQSLETKQSPRSDELP